jgi:hypothetical protein
VGAAHIRKFTAALLHTTSSGKPIVLRSEEGVGDGPRAASRTISAEADALAFCATHTGLDPWSAPYFCRRVQKVAEDTTPIPVEPIEAQSHAPMRRELTKFDALPIVTISISSLLLDQFARQGDENDEHTRALTESGEQLPPIVVHGPSMRVINGIHQVRAAIMRGEKTIGARIYHGTYYDDAVFMVVRMSIAHGLP